MTWIWQDHGNLDQPPQLMTDSGELLHIEAGPEVEMSTLLLIASAPELLAATKTVIAWFTALKDEQYRQLVHHQTLESASSNWRAMPERLLQNSLDLQTLIAAIKKAEGQ